MPEPGFLRAVEVLTNALLTPQEFARHKPAPGQQELRWITIHSHGEGEEGRRIQINTKTGEIEKGFGAGKTMHEAFSPKSEASVASETPTQAEEFKSPFHGDEESRHWYGASNRPIGHVTVPRGFVETKNHDAFRHGAVAYPQPLSDKDQYDYELTPIHGDDAIPELAKKLGGEMDKYASQYADPENDGILDDFLGQEGPRKLLGHVDKDKLKAEFRKQFGQPEEEAAPESQKPDDSILSKYPSLAEPPKQAEMSEMIRAAAGYQLHGMRNEPEDRAAWREHSQHMTKSAIDGWLMKKFGIDSATARAVSNAAGEMNPFTTEGAGTVGGQGVKWNHNSPEPTMEELGDMPWMKSGEAGEKGGLSKEQITKRLDELYAHPGPIGEAQEKLDSAKRDFDFEHQVHQHGGGFVVTKSDWSKGGRSSPISEVFPTKDAANQHYRELREKHLKPHDDAVKSLDSERESLLKQERAITDPAPIDLSPSVNPIQTNRESLSSMRSAMKSRIAELEAKEASETKRLTSEKSRAKGAAKKDAIDDQWRAMKDDLSKQRQAVMQSHLKEIESHPEYQQEKAESSRKAKERQAADRVEDDARASDGDKANWDHIQSNGGYEAARDSLSADIKSLKSRLAKTKDANKWKLESNLASRERDLERVNALNEKFGQKQPAALPPEIAAKYPSLAEGVDAKPEAAKEPWEMTRDQFARQSAAKPASGGFAARANAKIAKPYHRHLVTQAVAEGKPVPPEVLAEYPELADAPEKSTQVSPSPEKSADGLVSDNTLFKRTGQQFEEIQKSLGIKNPKMGKPGADAVRKALASRPGGPVIAELLRLHEDHPDLFQRHGFTSPTEAAVSAIDGKFTKDQLVDASRWAASHESGEISRFMRDHIRAASGTDGRPDSAEHSAASAAGGVDRLSRSHGKEQSKALRNEADELMASSKKPFKPEGIPGEQMGLFDQDAGGQKSLFNVVKPDKKSKKAEPTSSTLEKIGDEHKSRSEESAPLPGQKSIEDQYPSLKGYGEPESEPEDNGWTPENHTKIAADDIGKLRKQDVYRLMENATGPRRAKMADYIRQNRPELAGEVQDSLDDLGGDSTEPEPSKAAESKPSGHAIDPLDIGKHNIAEVLENQKADILKSDPKLSPNAAASLAGARVFNALHGRSEEFRRGIDDRVRKGEEISDDEDAKYMAAGDARKNLHSDIVQHTGYRPMGEVDGHPEANKPLVGGNSQSSESAPKAKAKPAKFEMPTDEQLAGMSPKRHQAGYYLTHLDSALDDLQTARANLAKAKQPQSGYYPSTLKSAEAANKKAERAYKKEFLAAQAAKDKYEEFSRKAPHEELIHHLHEAMNHDGKCCYEKEEGEDDIADHVPADHRHMDKSVHELCRHLGASHPELQAAYENYTAAME
ncbi:hypothetical protein UFOVP1229_176 [uncultured Caudovirales phage]|uniref:Uncharacterized protein n=1 Tax=uncultured Caudovirales phage TaxID=2100421 RepID=A0A6J5R3H6_9CAUD|nr:hypothetical protein UFOVP1229_176 [uncultured Caudovirales phage]